MAHSLGVARSDLLIRHMSDPVPASFETLVKRRAQSEPVAHITGVQEFFGHKFDVSRDVLIPRADSETLIETAIEVAPNARRVLDLGTGSGALLIATLLELDEASGIGIDASQPALRVAQRNARRLGLDDNRAQFELRDWHGDGWAKDLETFDLVLCNPPYVETGAQLDRQVIEYEPSKALFAGSDGLDDYRILIPQLRGLLQKSGSVVLEIGATQAGSVSELAQAHGFATEVRFDLAKRPRALVLH